MLPYHVGLNALRTVVAVREVVVSDVACVAWRDACDGEWYYVPMGEVEWLGRYIRSGECREAAVDDWLDSRAGLCDLVAYRIPGFEG